MNFLDACIVFISLAFLVSYKRQGLVYCLVSTSSLCMGYALGLFLAPGVTKGLSSDMSQGVASLTLIFGLAIIGGLAGMYVGRKLRMRIVESRLFQVDKLLAWPYKLVAVMVGIILLSQTLIYIPILSLQFMAQSSSILMATDKLFPIRLVEGQAKKIAPTQFRDLKLEYDPTPLTYNNIAGADDFQAVVDSVAPSVVKISGRSCIGLGFGSGFVVAPGLVVTNAHVIAGSGTIYISDHAGAYPATPILIDTGHDVAILYSRFLATPPLPFLNKKAAAGTESIILGYTYGGDLQMKRAIVAANNVVNFNPSKTKLSAANSLTFDGGTGTVGPGNSGGPVLNRSGQVIGILNGGFGDKLVAISSDEITGLVTKAKTKLFPARTDFCGVFQGYY